MRGAARLCIHITLSHGDAHALSWVLLDKWQRRGRAEEGG